MIIGSIKFGISFVISFLLLSIPVGNKSVFYHINHLTGPLTNEVYSSGAEIIKDGYQISARYLKKLFSSEIPKKISSENPVPVEQIESYTETEQRLLRELLKPKS